MSNTNKIVTSYIYVPIHYIDISVRTIQDYFLTTHGVWLSQEQAVNAALWHFSIATKRITGSKMAKGVSQHFGAIQISLEAAVQFSIPLGIHKTIQKYATEHKIPFTNILIFGITYVAASFAECTDAVLKVDKMIRETRSLK